MVVLEVLLVEMVLLRPSVPLRQLVAAHQLVVDLHIRHVVVVLPSASARFVDGGSIWVAPMVDEVDAT